MVLVNLAVSSLPKFKWNLVLLETGWTTLLVLKAACSSEISVTYQNVRRLTSEGIYGYNSLVFQNGKT